jgi:hypothetical protein
MSIMFDVDPALARRTQAKTAAELEGTQTIAVKRSRKRPPPALAAHRRGQAPRSHRRAAAGSA